MLCSEQRIKVCNTDMQTGLCFFFCSYATKSGSHVIIPIDIALSLCDVCQVVVSSLTNMPDDRSITLIARTITVVTF